MSTTERINEIEARLNEAGAEPLRDGDELIARLGSTAVFITVTDTPRDDGTTAEIATLVAPLRIDIPISEPDERVRLMTVVNNMNLAMPWVKFVYESNEETMTFELKQIDHVLCIPFDPELVFEAAGNIAQSADYLDDHDLLKSFGGQRLGDAFGFSPEDSPQGGGIDV